MTERAALEQLIEEMRARADEHRVYRGVPCQCEPSWHAAEIDGWIVTGEEQEK